MRRVTEHSDASEEHIAALEYIAASEHDAASFCSALLRIVAAYFLKKKNAIALLLQWRLVDERRPVTISARPFLFGPRFPWPLPESFQKRELFLANPGIPPS